VETDDPPAKGLTEQFPPLRPNEALVEANRCLYCYDAPCTHACPTHIDIPRFIKKIATNNLVGSASAILEANLLGAIDAVTNQPRAAAWQGFKHGNADILVKAMLDDGILEHGKVDGAAHRTARSAAAIASPALE